VQLIHIYYQQLVDKPNLENPRVAGSIPALGTTYPLKIKHLNSAHFGARALHSHCTLLQAFLRWFRGVADSFAMLNTGFALGVSDIEMADAGVTQCLAYCGSNESFSGAGWALAAHVELLCRMCSQDRGLPDLLC